MDLKTTDKRLHKRLIREGRTSAAEIEKAALKGEDLSSRVRPSSDEDLEQIGQELLDEHRIREERIERLVRQGEQVSPVPGPPLEPETEE